MAGRNWTDERRSAFSKKMKEVWKRPGIREEVSEAWRLKRENGENLVNIEQLASEEDFRNYQREYKRIYYKRPDKYAAWKEYSYEWKLKQRSMDELLALRDKHAHNGNEKSRQRVEKVLWMKFDEFIEKIKREAEKIDEQLHSNP